MVSGYVATRLFVALSGRIRVFLRFHVPSRFTALNQSTVKQLSFAQRLEFADYFVIFETRNDRDE